MAAWRAFSIVDPGELALTRVDGQVQARKGAARVLATIARRIAERSMPIVVKTTGGHPVRKDRAGLTRETRPTRPANSFAFTERLLRLLIRDGDCPTDHHTLLPSAIRRRPAAST